MDQVATGVWQWQAPHPDWEVGEDWPEVVTSYAIDDGARLLIFDPIAPPDGLAELAADREAAIVLTCPWHRRDAVALAERLSAPLYVPPPDEGDPDPVPGEVFRAGDALPVGVRALPGMEPNDLVLWVAARAALVFGDTLIDVGDGLIFPRHWADKHGSADAILAALQPLLDLPVELALPTHGSAGDRPTLERALAAD
jgi:hypothetical protein